MDYVSKTIQDDFDRIALLSDDGWDHNFHYHDYLLKCVPAGCGRALEVGCGTGAFSRRLASHADEVLGIDLSPQMIRLARDRSQEHLRIRYEMADALAFDWSEDRFDFVASIATLHHLPTETALHQFKRLLNPGGVLAILDLYKQDTVREYLSNCVAVPANVVLSLIHNSQLRSSREVRDAWAEHASHDKYSTIGQLRQICQKLLPGAVIKKHLLWRYSLLWQKPHEPRSI